MDKEELEPSATAREWIELKLGALKSEMRTYFILSVAGNAVLTHLSLSSTLGYVTGGALVGAVVIGKVAASFL